MLFGTSVTALLLGWLFLARRRDRLQRLAQTAALEAFGQGVLIVDRDLGVVYASPGARQLLELPAPVAGRPAPPSCPQLLRLLREPDLEQGEFARRISASQSRYFQVRLSTPKQRGWPSGMRVVAVREETQRREVDERLRQLAYYDNLTGLANRRRFMETLATAIESAGAQGEHLAVLYIDLDRFKEINDTMGHSAGDELLRIVTRRLRQHVRSRDRRSAGGRPGPSAEIARLGGDEFAILLRDLGSAEDVARVAQRIVDVVREPVWIGDQSVMSSLSIGISLFPQDGTDLDSVMHNADAALYQAKARGRDCFEFFQPVLDAAARRTAGIKLQLGQAIARAEFELHYQPKVDLEGSRVVGAEALLRWTNAELGSVGPAEFIPIAESANHILAIGTWVIDEACAQLQAWAEEGLELLPVAVNVSSHQFAQPGFARSVAESLRRHGVAPELLELELTESSLLEDTETTEECLRELRAMGLRISLDDFGTGHAALSYLTRIPLDTLKLDRTLVRDIDSDPAARGITAAVIGMAHSLGLKVVAEGLDHEDHVRALRELGCDHAQGFIFGAAVRADTFALSLAPNLGEADAESAEPRSEAIAEEGPESREADTALAEPAPVPAGGDEERPSLEVVRYALLIDDAEGSLGPVALTLTRLGILVLYARSITEGFLLAEQESGHIRAIAVAPGTPLDLIPDLVAEVAAGVGGATPPVVVIGDEPDVNRRSRLREVGASWALWSPNTEDELRFVLNTSMALPSERSRRAESRAPVALDVSFRAAESSNLGRMISLGAGGAFIQTDSPPPVGTVFQAGFAIGPEEIEVEVEAIHTNLRDNSLCPTFPRGVGVAFRGLDTAGEGVIRELVKERLATCAP